MKIKDEGTMRIIRKYPRKYPIVCPSCLGLGRITDPNVWGSSSTGSCNLLEPLSMTVVCPACNGSKIVLVYR